MEVYYPNNGESFENNMENERGTGLMGLILNILHDLKYLIPWKTWYYRLPRIFSICVIYLGM